MHEEALRCHSSISTDAGKALLAGLIAVHEAGE
jgi:hypothetical protein